MESVVEHVRDDVQQKMQQNQKRLAHRRANPMLQSEISDGDGDEIDKLEQKVKEKRFSAAIQEKLDEEFGRMRLMQRKPGICRLAQLYRLVSFDSVWRLYGYRAGLEKGQEKSGCETFWPGKGQGADSRIRRRIEADRCGEQGADHLSGRSSGCGKDDARAFYRGISWAKLCPGDSRRRAGRGGNPRTPSHVYRFDAWALCPGAATCEMHESRHPARRNRQDGKRLSGRSGKRDARSSRSELNPDFTDHFMEVGLDFSKVLFIATANSEASIPAPLEDRMEVVRLPGYYPHEKLAIAKVT